MAYDNPQSLLEKFAIMDFGAAAGVTTHYLATPAGKKGNLKDIGVVLTEVTAWTTTDGLVQLGTEADADAYAQLEIASGSLVNTNFNTGDDPDAIIDIEIPADTPLVMRLTEGTGGSLTGQGKPYVVIDWY